MTPTSVSYRLLSTLLLAAALFGCAAPLGDETGDGSGDETATESDALLTGDVIETVHAGNYTLRGVTYRLEVTTRVPRATAATQTLTTYLYTGTRGSDAVCNVNANGVPSSVQVRVIDAAGRVLYDHTREGTLATYGRMEQTACNAAVQNRNAPAVTELRASSYSEREQATIGRDVVGLGIFETYGTLLGIAVGGTVEFAQGRLVEFAPRTDRTTRTSRAIYSGVVRGYTPAERVTTTLGVNPRAGRFTGLTDWEQTIPVTLTLEP